MAYIMDSLHYILLRVRVAYLRVSVCKVLLCRTGGPPPHKLFTTKTEKTIAPIKTEKMFPKQHKIQRFANQSQFYTKKKKKKKNIEKRFSANPSTKNIVFSMKKPKFPK